MKRSIYIEFLIGYVIFAIVSVVMIQTLGVYLVNKRITKNEAHYLYTGVSAVASDFYHYIYNQRGNEEGFSEYLESAKAYLNCELFVINSSDDKTVVASTSTTTFLVSIPDFDREYFGNQYYKVGNLYGTLDDGSLIVYYPVVHNYNVAYYCIGYTDAGYVKSIVASVISYIYIICGVLYGISFIILLIFHFRIYIPLKRVTAVTKEYAKGNYEYVSNKKLPKGNEMETLSTSVRFMGEKFKSMEDDEKKFVANVSHDFRSPLTSIHGYIEAMRDGTIPPENYDKYFGIVITEADRLKKLTENLLVLNTSGGNKKLDLREFDLNEVLRNTLLSFEVQCEKKNILLDVIYGQKTYMVCADKLKIQQVLYNLVDNAIKFSHHDSTITIKTYSKGEKIFTSIKDTGIGISKESINKIWNRFYKSDTSRGKDKTGTGLGLSIVKEIITNHGENINCISTEGVGTEFIFSLARGKTDDSHDPIVEATISEN